MEHHRIWPGVALIAAVAVSFAAGTTFAGLSYRHGMTPLPLVALRTAVGCAVLFAILAMTRKPVRLPRRIRTIALGLGLLQGFSAYCLLAAVFYIPVGLAALTFYLFPILVALGAALIGQERLTLGTLAALLVAFSGLVLAVDLGGGTVDPRGVAFGVVAAATIAVVILTNRRIVGSGDSRQVTLHMLTAGTVGLTLSLGFSGDIQLPATAAGWWAVVLATGFYTFAIIGVYVAVSMIGAVRTSLFLNLEPVSSMTLGFLILGQLLSPLQLLGGGLVIAALLGVGLQEARRRSVVPQGRDGA